jgi:RHS repeat-associated protein
MKEVVGQGQTWFVYDMGESDLPGWSPLICEYDAKGNIINRFHYGNLLIALDNNNNKLWFNYDDQFSVRQILDNNSKIIEIFHFDAFGNDLQEFLFLTQYRYKGIFGYYTDNETQLLLLGLRYYSPSIGRFISQDMLKAELNWYLYVESNPVNGLDPTGLQNCRYNRLEVDLTTPSIPLNFQNLLSKLPVEPRLSCRISLRLTQATCRKKCAVCEPFKYERSCQGGGVGECTIEIIWRPFPQFPLFQIWGFGSINFEIRGFMNYDPCKNCWSLGVEGKIRVSLGLRGGLRGNIGLCKPLEAWAGGEVQGRVISGSKCECGICRSYQQGCVAARIRAFLRCGRVRYTHMWEWRLCGPERSEQHTHGPDLSGLCPELPSFTSW